MTEPDHAARPPAGAPAAAARPGWRRLAAGTLALLRHPWGADLLQDPGLCRILALAPLAVLPVLFTAGWPCPFHVLTGIPCPGCGMTRALAALLHGDLAGALRLHPFVPLVAGAWLVLAVGAVLPAAGRRRLHLGLERLERRLALSGLALAAFLLFGLARMVAVALGLPCAA